ncbi:MAG: SRPBCC family protein [Rhodoferax sp.]|nr:SRPBCC family protein [Rhodoferax sp.]
MTTTLIFVAAFCVVAVLVYMARYSGRVRVNRTRLIDAPIDAVFAQVQDFAHWDAWNPWLAHSPEARLTISNPGNQPGSTCAWDSPRAGAGLFALVASKASTRIQHTLRIQQPFLVHGRSTWTFAERDGKTEVRWQLKARVAFFMRAFSPTVRATLDLDCRYGLDRLASLLEPAHAARYQLTLLGPREVPACRYVYQSYEGPIQALPNALHQTLAALRAQLRAQGVTETGAPLAFYLKTNIKLRTTVCLMGLPVGDADVGALQVREMPAHVAYGARLQGGTDALELAWYLAMQSLTHDQRKPDQRLPPFENYLQLADTTHSNDSVTEVNIPLLP